MGESTLIGWCHHSFNGWWGCDEVSPACDHCYARDFAKRLGKHLWGANAPRPIASPSYWHEPFKWARKAAAAGERRRVFAHSMSDVCEDRRDLDVAREYLWTLIDATGYALDWLLLTKRPEHAPSLMPARWRERPPSYVWWMTTVENQEQAAIRVPQLRRIPAAVRGISAEPLLGSVDLDAALGGFVHLDDCECGHWVGNHYPADPVAHPCQEPFCGCLAYRAPLDWIIVGAESGRKRRAMDMAWVRRLAARSTEAHVALYVKQGGALGAGEQADIPDDLWARKEFPRAA